MLNSTRIDGYGRILLVTPQPFYEDRGTPIAVKYVAQALSELGASVDLLAFPVGSDTAIPNVHITRCGNPLRLRRVPIGFSWRKLALDMSLWQSFERLLYTGSYGLVHAVEEAAYMAAVLCPRLGIQFIYDMASSIPAELSRRTPFRLPAARPVLARMEQHVIRMASRVICSSGLGDHVQRQVPEANVREWHYPAFTPNVDWQRVAALRMDLGLTPQQRVVLYSGNLAGYQGIELLLDAFDRARRVRPELVLVCVGATERDLKGPEGAALAARDNLRVVLRQPRSKMPEYLKLADYLVLPRVAADNAPLKLFDYMASGTPIIATRGSAHEPLLNEARAFMSDPDPQSFAGALLRASESPERAAAVAEAAQTYARQHFGWDRFVEFVRITYCDALGEAQEFRRLVAS